MANKYTKIINSVIAFLMFVLLLTVGCSFQKQKNRMPQKHLIDYEDNLDTLNDDCGADSYCGSLDSPGSKYYVTHDFYNMKNSGGLHIIPQFETYQQTTEYTCGCAALKMVLHHYGIDSYNEMQLAEMACTDETRGTDIEGICNVLDYIGLGYDCHIGTDSVFESSEDVEIYFIKCIDNGIPVIVDWEDWGGHWQVVIGIDTMDTINVEDDVIILADPYDVTDHYQDGYYTFPFARFVSMWREGKCAGKAVVYEQPYVAVIKGTDVD